MSGRVRVDDDACVGHGRCYVLAPEVFGADERGHCTILVDDLDSSRAEQAAIGADNCPERAITIEST